MAATRLPRSSINESLGKHQVRLDLPGKRTRLDQAELVLQGSPGRESLHSRRGTRQTIELCMRTLWGYTSRLIRMSPLRGSESLHWTAAGSPSIIDLSVSLAICTLQPDVPRLLTSINAGIIVDLGAMFLDSVEQAMSSAYYRISRFTT